MTTQPNAASPQDGNGGEEIDQDSEATNTAPPGERPTDPEQIAEAAGDDAGDQ